LLLGARFETTTETLTKVPDSMLSAMFSGRFPIEPGEDGYFFFDRDPKHFAALLSYLRTGRLELPTSAQDRRELLHEAEYFQIKPLIALISKDVPTISSEVIREFTIAMYGLDSSGKTTLVRRLLAADSNAPVGPTIGFNVGTILIDPFFFSPIIEMTLI